MALDWLKTQIRKIGENYWSRRDKACLRLYWLRWWCPHKKIVRMLRAIAEDAPHHALVVAVELDEKELADYAAQIVLCDTKGGYTEQTIDLACQWCRDRIVMEIWRNRVG